MTLLEELMQFDNKTSKSDWRTGSKKEIDKLRNIRNSDINNKHKNENNNSKVIKYENKF